MCLCDGPVHGAPCLLPNGSWDRLRPHCDPGKWKLDESYVKKKKKSLYNIELFFPRTVLANKVSILQDCQNNF